MIGFDAHFVMLALRPAIPASVDHAKDRVLHLLEKLQSAKERIVVPTPALTEFLVHAETAAPHYLDELQRSSRFRIASYGIRAAVEVAAEIEAAVTKKDKRDGTRDTWAKVNFDRQIAGICKVEDCHTIYTDDAGVKKFSEKLGLKVIGLNDLDLPSKAVPPPLIQQMMEHEDEQKASVPTANSAGPQAKGARSTGNKAGAKEKVQARAKGQRGKAMN